METLVVQNEDSKSKNTAIDGKEWQSTKFMVPSLSLRNKFGDTESLREEWGNLNKPEERRLQTQWATEVTQNKRKAWHDTHFKMNMFQPRQRMLKYDGRNEIKRGKLKVKWVGPYQVREVGNNSAIKLWSLDGQEIPDLVSGSKLKRYHPRKTPSSSSNDEIRRIPSSSPHGQV